jgi:hypothetical protein
MFGFRLVARAAFATVLAVVLLSGVAAKAQGVCNFLSGSQKTACQNAAAALANKKAADAQKAKAAANQPVANTTGTVSGAGNGTAAAAAPESAGVVIPVAQQTAPAQNANRFEIAKGGLFVDMAGNYPQGYGPTWVLTGTQPQPVITNRYNVLNHGPQGTETLFVRITDVQGQAVLEFFRRGTMPCDADIVGLPQVITSTPKQFNLANFRYANNQGPQCQRAVGSKAPWQGSITLSANANGDLALSLVLDMAMASGAPWFEFTAQNLPFVNQMTPQMAAAAAASAQKAAVNAQAVATARAADAAPAAGLSPSANSPARITAAAGQVAKSSAQPQTYAQKDLDAAEAAYSQAQMQAENDKKAIVNCSTYTGNEKFNCDVQASKQQREIDGRVQQAYFKVLNARISVSMATPLTPEQQKLSDALLAPIRAQAAEMNANPLYKCVDESYGAVAANVTNGYGESHKQWFGTKIIKNTCKFTITVDIADTSESGFFGPNWVAHRLDAGSTIEIPQQASWKNPVRVNIK